MSAGRDECAAHGPPGVDKTRPPVGQAAEIGYRTYVTTTTTTTAVDLAPHCHRAAIEGRLPTTLRSFAGPTLRVIDEHGYRPLPAGDVSAVFQLTAERYSKTSTIITTNRPITSWGRSRATRPSPPRCWTWLPRRSVVRDIIGEP